MEAIKKQLESYGNGVYGEFFISVVDAIKELELELKRYKQVSDIKMVADFLELSSDDQQFILDFIKFLQLKELKPITGLE